MHLTKEFLGNLPNLQELYLKGDIFEGNCLERVKEVFSRNIRLKTKYSCYALTYQPNPLLAPRIYKDALASYIHTQ